MKTIDFSDSTDVQAKSLPLNLEQAAKFRSMQIPFDNVGVMSGTFQGDQVAIIFAEDGGKVEPLALILDREFLERNQGELFDMHGEPVTTVLSPSIIIDPNQIDTATVNSVMSSLTGDSK